MTHDCHINNNIEQFVRVRLIELIKKINTAERVQVSPTEPSAAVVYHMISHQNFWHFCPTLFES
jgi:hypothetical protein